MKNVRNYYSLALILLALVIATDAQKLDGNTERSAVAIEFRTRVEKYAEQRAAIESKFPPLDKQSSAVMIAAHKNRLLKSITAARRDAKRGSIFTSRAERLIRSIITEHYSDSIRAKLRKELLEAENASVPVSVNRVYPESAEMLEMPPALLLVLPGLPKGVRYRLVGTNLLLVDSENNLIIDYMTNVLL